MAKEPVNAKLGYMVLYVDDVDRAVKFYSDVFELQLRKEDKSHRWAEMETGGTTLAFTPIAQHEAAITGGVEKPAPGEKPRPNIDVGLNVYDVSECLARAVKAGGRVLAQPEQKVWGQTVAYVSDLDGITIRIGSQISHV